MITDAELLELEILLKGKYESHIFGQIFYNEATNEIVINLNEIDQLLVYNYPNRYKIDPENNYTIMSLDLFQLVKSRYFPNNQTAVFVNL